MSSATILESRLAATSADATAVSPVGDGGTDTAAGKRLRALLVRVAGVAELRQQTVADLARELRFRYFEEPVLELAFRAVYEDTDRMLDALRADPEAAQRGSWIDQVVSCPQPLRARLRQRYVNGASSYRKALLEIHLRRYYRIRTIRDLATGDADGHLLCWADYDFEDKPVHIVVAYTALDELARGRGGDRQPRGAPRPAAPPRRRHRHVAQRRVDGGRADGG